MVSGNFGGEVPRHPCITEEGTCDLWARKLCLQMNACRRKLRNELNIVMYNCFITQSKTGKFKAILTSSRQCNDCLPSS